MKQVRLLEFSVNSFSFEWSDHGQRQRELQCLGCEKPTRGRLTTHSGEIEPKCFSCVMKAIGEAIEGVVKTRGAETPREREK